jgi:hypothetical protein
VKLCLDMVSRHSIILLEIYVNVLVEVCQHEPPLLKVSLEFVILLWFQLYGGVSGLFIDVQDVHQYGYK